MFGLRRKRKQKPTCLSKIYEEVNNGPSIPPFHCGEKLGRRVKRIEVVAEGIVTLGDIENMRCVCKDGCGKTCYLPFKIPIISENKNYRV